MSQNSYRPNLRRIQSTGLDRVEAPSMHWEDDAGPHQAQLAGWCVPALRALIAAIRDLDKAPEPGSDSTRMSAGADRDAVHSATVTSPPLNTHSSLPPPSPMSPL